MKLVVLSATSLAFLAAHCVSSLIDDELGALHSFGASSGQPIQEWVFKRQVARAHMHDLSGEDVIRHSEIGIHLPHPPAEPVTPASRTPAVQHKGRMAPRTQRGLSHNTPERQKEEHWPNEAAASDVNIPVKGVAKHEKLADQLKRWRKTQKSLATATTTATPRVRMKRVTKSHIPFADTNRSPRNASQEGADSTNLVKPQQAKQAEASNKTVDDAKMSVDKQSPTPTQTAVQPKNATVTSAQVMDVKVVNITVKDAEPALPIEKASLPKQELEKAPDVAFKKGQQPTLAESTTPPRADEVWNAKVMHAQASDPRAGKPKVVLSCVCAGQFRQGDRIQYLGHAFPPGRRIGTVLAGTRNGYLNIEWDDFHQGHGGNCQLSHCGGCENTAMTSRWFTACSDVKMLE